MDELISKKAAIDALHTWFRDGFDEDKWWNSTHVLAAIEGLPPAQLGTNLAEVGTDCISRQAAIDAMAELQGRASTKAELKGISKAWKRIEQLPPIQPEIVRCKDCKHWIPYDWMFNEVWRSKNMADYPEDEIGCNWCDMAMKADDFCSRGEKREVTT